MITGRLQTKGNYWYCILNLHHPDGRKQQKWVSTGLSIKGNKRKAEAILLDLRRKYTTLSDIARHVQDTTLADYMLAWLKDVKSQVAKSTYLSYTEIVKKGIVPYFQDNPVLLMDVAPMHIENYYQYLLERGLSNNTILHHHANLHKALNNAVKQRLVVSNPATLADRPRKQKYVSNPYTKEETRELLKCIEGDAMELLITLAIFYGLRRSEIAGLCWDDINFNAGTLTICHSLQRRSNGKKPFMLFQSTLKRNACYRTLPLIDAIAEKLEVHKKEQSFVVTDLPHNFVFRSGNGEVVKPNNISLHFTKILKRHGLRHIRFHDLRHGCASMLIAERVPLIEVQQWLGHSSISTTADMYAHLDFSMKERSAAALENELYTPTHSINMKEDIHEGN